MGDYTVFICDVQVRNEYQPLIERLFKSQSWDEAVKEYPGLNLDNWLKLRRRDFIPYGSISSYNESYVNMIWWKKDRFSFENGRWAFVCDLKNYENEIETFVNIVLSKIVDKPYLVFSKFEYSKHPNFYMGTEPENYTMYQDPTGDDYSDYLY